MEKIHPIINRIKLSIEEYWILIIIISIGFILRIINLYQYPFVFIDENVYVARAWSFIKYGWIDVYPLYSEYDHPYFGWILIGILSSLYQTGYYYESARVTMIIIWCVQTIILYQICKKLTTKSVGLFAAFLYSINLEYVVISRTVLIDNVALLFLLMAILTFQINRRWWISAIFTGIASLCKYTYLIFAVSFIIYYIILKIKDTNNIVLKNTEKRLNFHSINEFVIFFLRWLATSVSIFLIWPLLALYRGEFFPDGIHQSMIVRFIGQITDRGFIPFWEPDSYFNQSLNYFINENFFLILVPIICIIYFIILLILKKNEIKKQIQCLMPLVFMIPYLIFLMRGGIVYYFYFIPLFPLGSMIIAFSLHLIKDSRGILNKRIKNSSNIRKYRYSIRELVVILNLFVLFGIYPFNFESLYSQENTHLQDMFTWVSINIPKTAVCASSGELLPEFRENGFERIYIYYRCTSLDHLFNSTVLFGDWKNIDYFILNNIAPDVLNETFFVNENILRTAFQNSEVIQVFGSDSNQINVYRVINT